MARHNARRIARLFLLGACLVMAALMARQAFSLAATRHRTTMAAALKEKIAPAGKPDVEGPDMSEYSSLSQAAMFFPKPDNKPQPPSLGGLLGDYAMIDGQMAGVGDTVNNWEVKSIRGATVVVVQGEERHELKLDVGSSSLVIDGRGDKKDLDMNMKPAEQPRRSGSRPGGRGPR